MTMPDMVVVDTSALYQVPDYLAAALLPDARTGVGDPVPLAQRMRIAFPGKPTGSNAAVSVTGTPVTLTVPDDALSCLLQVLTAPIRFTTDGSVPSGANGLRADAGTLLQLTGRETMQAVRLVAETATSASVVPLFHT